MPKPRRKYTVTEKVLAACRANLLKARAVDPAIRLRPTPARAAASRANLLKAHSALHAQPGLRAYGTCFTRGMYAGSLERSLGLAGESAEEFRAHLALFNRALGPTDALERRLARGIAEAAWRRLRVTSGQAHWEKMAVVSFLREAAGARIAGPSGARSGAECHSGLRGPDGEPLSPADFDAAIADRVLSCFQSDRYGPDFARKLNERLERLWRLWLEERAADTEDFAYYTRARPLDRARLIGRSAAALGNPFVAPARLEAGGVGAQAAGLEPYAPALPPASEWIFDSEDRAAPSPFAGDSSEEAYRRSLAYRFSHGRPGGPALGRGLAEAECHSALEDFSAFLALFEHAFGVPGASGVRPGGAGGGGEPEKARALRREIRAAARLCWKRLEVMRRHAGRERARLRAALETAIAGRARPRLGEDRALAAALLLVFDEVEAARETAESLERKLRAALHRFLLARHGRTPLIDCLRPLRRERKESWMDDDFEDTDDLPPPFGRAGLRERLAYGRCF